MADVNALYPQPAPVAPGLMSGDPSKIIGLVGALNQNALFQKQFPALAEQPAAALEGQRIANTTAQLEQDSKRNGFIVDSLGSLADDPKLNVDKVRNVAVTMARNLKIPGAVVNSWIDNLPKDPAKLRDSLIQMRNMAIGSAGVAGRVSAPPTEAGAPQTAPLGAANYAGTAPIGLSPKETASQTQTGAGAGSAVNEARVHGLNFTQQVFPLEQAIPALETLGKTGTGPGTEEFNHIKSFLQSAGIPGFDANKIKDFDEAKKYLTDFVNQNGNSGTNDKLAASFAGNPSVNISNAAAVDVAKSALALRRMKQAQLVAFENSGKPEQDFPKEAGKWAREHDPRAYGFDLMTPEARKKVLESLPAAKRELFMLDVQDALKNGIIKAPR